MRNKLHQIFISITIICGVSCHSQLNNDVQNNFNKKLLFDPTNSIDFRPNIIWLVAEDLSPVIAAFGDSTVHTPALDRLAKEGVIYTNVYSPSGVCAPGRCALVTGMYPSGIGAHNMRVQYNKEHLKTVGLTVYEVVPPPEVRMMSQIFRENGYYCTNNLKEDYQFAPALTAWDESSMKAHWRNRPKGSPFFSVFNFEVTHEGYISRPFSKQAMRYNQPNFPDSMGYLNKDGMRIDEKDWVMHIPEDQEVPIPPYLPETEIAKKDIRRLYSNLVELDNQISLILHQLESDGFLDSTIVVFFSDHGGPLPRQKRLIYDSGLKVPMIIRYPGQIGAGTFDDQLISFVDFAPTSLSITGIKPPNYMQGKAFLGKYINNKTRKYIHAAADRFDDQYDRLRAVKDNRFKYIRNYHTNHPYYLPVKYREEMGIMQELLRLNQADSLNEYQSQWFRETKPKEELFDTREDPDELNNLADNPEYEEKLNELRTECDRWMSEIHDMGHIPEEEILDSFWPDRSQPITKKPMYIAGNGMIRLSCKTEGASIGYQVIETGKDPATAWKIYTEPIPISTGKTIIVKAHRIGFKPSAQLEISFQ